jgi:predicted dehydrogenase
MRTPVNIGVVGLGETGGSFTQVFDGLPNCDLRWLCDIDQGALLATRRYPHSSLTASLDDLLGDESLDAVVLATPPDTHGALVERALRADKDVLVANPLARTADDALRLTELAHARSRCLLAAETLLFHPALRKLKEIMETGRLGETFYLYGNRQGLSRARHEASVLWSLGVQEVAALLYLLDDTPVDVSCRGESYIRPGVEDVAFCFLRFATGVTAHLHLSSLDPQTLGRLTLVGSRQMVVFDALAPERSLTIHDRAVALPRAPGHGQLVRIEGDGSVVSPAIAPDDPLQALCETFLAAVRRGRPLEVEGSLAVRVVAVLEALQRSLERLGSQETVAAPARRLPNVVSLRTA